MKRLSVALTILMLSAGALTACSGGSDTLAQPDKETKSQWGLNLEESTEEETEESTEKETEKETESANSTEAVITEVTDGVKMMETEETKIKSMSPVNVRSGPGTDFDKIGGLLNEEIVTMDGICDNGWVHIQFDGKEGYVSMEFMEAEEEGTDLQDLLKEAQKVIENGGTVQESSREESEEETSEETEEETTAKETEKETKKETEQETKKETTADKMDETGKSSSTSAWATIDVNVRKGPGSNYDSIGVLKQDEKIKVLDNSDPWWWKVEFNGKKAYVSVQYLTTDEPEE